MSRNLKMLCLLLLIQMGSSGSDDLGFLPTIRFGNLELDTARERSLKTDPELRSTFDRILSFGSTLTGQKAVGRQLYVVTDEATRLSDIEMCSGAKVGTRVAENAFLATASRETVETLAGCSGVHWVGLRDSRHKIDAALLALTSEAASPDESRRRRSEALRQQYQNDPQGIFNVDKLMVELVPQKHQFLEGQFTVEGFAAQCREVFRQKDWQVDVRVVSKWKLILEVWGQGEVAEASSWNRLCRSLGFSFNVQTPLSISPLIEWLANQWQVLRIEPKPMHKLTSRYTDKLLSLYDVEDNYNTDLTRQILDQSLTNPDQTGVWTVEAQSASALPGSGKFCFWLNDIYIPGENGTSAEFLSPLVSGMVNAGAQFYEYNSKFWFTSFVLNASGLSGDDDYYSGMQISFGPNFATYTTIETYNGASKTVMVNPGFERSSNDLSGEQFQIWPVMQPGDKIKVFADSSAWSATLKMNWLPNGAEQEFKFGCPSIMSAEQRMPAMLWNLGFRTIQNDCEMDVSQSGTVQVPSIQGLNADNAESVCWATCQSAAAVDLLEKQQLCVTNVSAIVWNGQWENGMCTCSLDSIIPMVLTAAIPESNPLWNEGLTGQGQIVGVADSGIDVGNCLFSEFDTSGEHSPAPDTADFSRQKVVGVVKNDDCALCDGCPKLIRWDSWILFPELAQDSIWNVAFPHTCENIDLTIPVGCATDAQDALLEPRRYAQYGANVEINIACTLQPPFEPPGRVKLFILMREDYESYTASYGSDPTQDPPQSQCLNPNCNSVLTGEVNVPLLKLPPSRRGYGVVIKNEDSSILTLKGQLPDGRGVRFHTAGYPCGDASDSAAGHGTLCAGIAVGSIRDDYPTNRAQRQYAKNYQGIAKDARLLMFDLSSGVSGSDNLTLPLDIEQGLLQPIRENGARIVSNSWSCDFPTIVCDALECAYTPQDYCNVYNTHSKEVDNFAWENQDTLVLISAGDSNGATGDTAPSTLRAPGTCKNCLSIGSTHTWNSAIQQAVPFIDAMDFESAPLGSHRLMCPQILSIDESRWPQNKDGASDESSDAVQTTPVPQETPSPESLGAPSVPAACCNSTPGYNDDVQRVIDGYQDLIDTNRANGRPATADLYQNLQNEEKSKLFPCVQEPHCCLQENSFCCVDNYRTVDPDKTEMLRRTKYDLDSIVGTSAKGPAHDSANSMTRFKPDIVGPGSFLVGANSGGASNDLHCGLPGRPDLPFNETQSVVAMSGTSVATAVIAGAAAIIRQYFADGWFPSGQPRERNRFEPSSALVKAMLLNGARSVTQDGGESGPVSPTPNYNEGWGRPSLLPLLFVRTLNQRDKLWIVDEKIGFDEGGWVHQYEFLCDMSGEDLELKVTLTWNDPPALAGAEAILVNDLDLNVTNEEAVGFVNNRICPIDPFTSTFAESCRKPIADRDNNVEQTTLKLLHKINCQYSGGFQVEYGECNSFETKGALVRQSKDRRPFPVRVRVIAHRVTQACESDGFYQTCVRRPQGYGLVVSGPLLTRVADGSVVPPILTSYRFEEPFVPDAPAPPPAVDENATVSSAPRVEVAQGRLAYLCVPSLILVAYLSVWHALSHDGHQ